VGLERVTVPARHEVGRKRRRWSLQNVDTKLLIFISVSCTVASIA
jgi:hypothetical protein